MADAESQGPPTLADLGEFALIERVTRGRALPGSVELGPGDDAAVLAVPDGRVVVSTDMLVQGRHFRLDWSSPEQVGRKAVAQNAADIEAMGARVSAFVVGFGAPADTAAAQVAELFDGMWAEASRLGVPIVGGDMVASGQWVVSVTVLGELDGRKPVARGGARAGAMVAIAGVLGRSAAGYALLRAGQLFAPELRGRHLVPEPPYGQGAVAAVAGAQALIDVSDGLLADLGHIATASGVSIDLDSEALRADVEPLTAAARLLGADPLNWVLTGGEDHALVGTFPDRAPPGWRVIGRVTAGTPGVAVDGTIPTGYTGWESFG